MTSEHDHESGHIDVVSCKDEADSVDFPFNVIGAIAFKTTDYGGRNKSGPISRGWYEFQYPPRDITVSRNGRPCTTLLDKGCDQLVFFNGRYNEPVGFSRSSLTSLPACGDRPARCYVNPPANIGFHTTRYEGRIPQDKIHEGTYELSYPSRSIPVVSESGTVVSTLVDPGFVETLTFNGQSNLPTSYFVIDNVIEREDDEAQSRSLMNRDFPDSGFTNPQDSTNDSGADDPDDETGRTNAAETKSPMLQSAYYEYLPRSPKTYREYLDEAVRDWIKGPKQGGNPPTESEVDSGVTEFLRKHEEFERLEKTHSDYLRHRSSNSEIYASAHRRMQADKVIRPDELLSFLESNGYDHFIECPTKDSVYRLLETKKADGIAASKALSNDWKTELSRWNAEIVKRFALTLHQGYDTCDRMMQERNPGTPHEQGAPTASELRQLRQQWHQEERVLDEYQPDTLRDFPLKHPGFQKLVKFRSKAAMRRERNELEREAATFRSQWINDVQTFHDQGWSVCADGY